jgi:hypothetical protein
VPLTKVRHEHEEMEVVSCNTSVCNHKGETCKVHEYSNKEKCFKINSNYSSDEVLQ